MGLSLRDTRHHTYGEYRSWPEDVRYELIDGKAYAMAPPLRVHQRVVGELFRQIADAIQGSPCEVNVLPFDVRLPDADEAEDDILNAGQPDIVVVCDPSKLDTRGCRSAPDLVIEVLSPSNDQACGLRAP